MAIFSSGYDKEGRHVISGGFYNHPYVDTVLSDQSHIPDKVKDINGMRPDSLHLDLEAGNKEAPLLRGKNNKYKLNGFPDLTVPGSVVAYLNGSPMYPKDYTIDMKEATIEIHKEIVSTDCDLEVRSKEDTNFACINDVLILEVIPGVIDLLDLPHYTPSYGDVLNVKRLLTISKNRKNPRFMAEITDKTEHAYVLSYEILPDGIHARIKIRN